MFGNCESGNLLSSSPWDLISTVSDPQTLQDGHSVPKNSPAASNEAVSVKSDATDPPKDELLAPWGSPVACDGAMSVKSVDTDPPSPDFPKESSTSTNQRSQSLLEGSVWFLKISLR